MIQTETMEGGVEQAFTILCMGVLFAGICFERYGREEFIWFVFYLFVCFEAEYHFTAQADLEFTV